ncbi:MAG: hypothetical protein NOOUEUKL_001672 [Candidatus Fervidibacter sp.]
MTLWARSLMVLALLFGLLFAVVMVIATVLEFSPTLTVALALAVVALEFLIAPFLLDWTLRWLFRFDWVDPDSVDPKMAAFLRELCQAHRIPVPRFGVIADARPNAFTYGHFPSNARLVITQGIVDMLDEEERKAVLAHEIGHIVHWDFVVMTVAAAIPVVLYTLYRTLLRASHRARRNGAYLWMVAIGAYLAYLIAHFLVLLLSRVREYYADEFSALATRNPNALATALAKIAYGLVAQVGEEDEKSARTKMETVRALGLFDPHMARSSALAAFASSTMTTVSPTAVVKATGWDLWNPWASLYELASTHPLPAKRLKALERLALRLGQQPAFDFPERPPINYRGAFAVDLFFTALPWVMGLMGLLVGLAMLTVHPSLMGLLGWVLLFGGIGYLVKVAFAYRKGEFVGRKVAELVGEVAVSGVRAIPCQVRGTLIGRGIPGYLLSADLVLQDETGFITLQYRQPIGLLNWLFALFRADELIGRTVTAIGWYRRAPAPFVELLKVRLDDGTEYRCYLYLGKLILGGLMIAGGIVLLLFPFVG